MTGTSGHGRAIIVVDPQPDFFEGGALAIAGATGTAQRIAEFLRECAEEYDALIVTQDWHVDPGEHWSSDPNFVTTWPMHCAAGTDGANIHFSLVDQPWDLVIRKGLHEGAYSGFDGVSENDAPLFDELNNAGIHKVTVVGFATDHCVKATALDARRLGFDVEVILDLCAGVAPETTQSAILEMRGAGITATTRDLR